MLEETELGAANLSWRLIEAAIVRETIKKRPSVRFLKLHARFPTAGPLMLVKNRDDHGDVLAANEVRGVWEIVQQRSPYAAADFWELIGKRRNAIDRRGKLL